MAKHCHTNPQSGLIPPCYLCHSIGCECGQNTGKSGNPLHIYMEEQRKNVSEEKLTYQDWWTMCRKNKIGLVGGNKMFWILRQN